MPTPRLNPAGAAQSVRPLAKTGREPAEGAGEPTRIRAAMFE
jgi:hypothetical protein